MIKTEIDKEIKMKKIFYLDSCSTNKKILKELNLDGFELQNIKEKNIDEETLDWIAKKARSYEALFSKRARKYKELNLAEKNLKEEDYKKLLLEEYTFLKRPFIINEEEVFIGNSKKTIEAAKQSLNK